MLHLVAETGPLLRAMKRIRNGMRGLARAKPAFDKRWETARAALPAKRKRINRGRRDVLAARAAVARHHSSIVSKEELGRRRNAIERRNRLIRRGGLMMVPIKPEFI